MRSPARFLPSLAALALLLAATTFPAPAQVLGPEFQVNSYTTDWQSLPAVSADPAGRFVVAWQSYGQGMEGCYGYQGSGCNGIIARRFGSSGQALGDEFQVNVSTASTQNDPAVASDASGNFVVAWDDDVFYFGPGDIWTRRFDAQGAPLTGQVLANSSVSFDQVQADVASDDSGNFVVIWSDIRVATVEGGTYGRRFDAAGTPLGPDFQIESAPSIFATDPTVARTGTGEFVVVWNRSSRVWGRHYDAAGLPDAGPFIVSPDTAAGGGSVAIQGPDGFVVVWHWSNGPDQSILGRLFDATATPRGDPFQINEGTTGQRSNPDVAVDASGSFLVVWESLDQDGSAQGVFARRFDAAGDPDGSEFRVNDFTTGDQKRPAVAATPGGSFLVTWQSLGQDGDGEGIFGRLVHYPLFADGFESGDTSRWSATQP